MCASLSNYEMFPFLSQVSVKFTDVFKINNLLSFPVSVTVPHSVLSFYGVVFSVTVVLMVP